MKAIFFTETWLQNNTAISQNVDYEDIMPFIEPAQETLIENRIGPKLYERLCEAINLRDWNDDELTLIELFRPAVAYHTVWMALPFLQTKIRNKGIIKGTDQYIQTISRDDMKDLRQEIKDMVGFYMKRVEDWLCLYSIRYPQYSDPDALNKKNIDQPFDFSGFMTYKGGWGYGYGLRDKEVILKTINWKRY
jgi:hypothetical protein